MWSHFQGQKGLSALKHGTSFISGIIEARNKRAWQKYNNAMTLIADAQNRNALVSNQNMAVGRSSVQAYEIGRSEYQTKAAAEVSAAAVGTTGRSVNQTLFQIEANAATAQSKRQRDLEAQILGIENQRRSSAFQAAQQLDYSFIPMPNPASTLLGIRADWMRIDEGADPLNYRNS